MEISETQITLFQVDGFEFSSREEAYLYIQRRQSIEDRTVIHGLVPGEWYYAPYSFLLNSSIEDQIDNTKGIFRIQFLDEEEILDTEYCYPYSFQVKYSRFKFALEDGTEFQWLDTADPQLYLKTDYKELIG